MTKMWLSRVVSLVLVLSLLLSCVVCANAQTVTEIEITVVSDKEYSLRMINDNSIWYVNSKDIADLANVEEKLENKNICYYIKSLNCLLFSISSDKYIVHKDTYYVPFQETSVNLGVKFHANKTIKVEVLRTPTQLRSEVKSIFNDKRFELAQITDQGIYSAMESLGRIYAVLPFVGSGSIIGAITGKDEAERYRTYMTGLMHTSGRLSDFVESTADFDGEVKKYANILDNAASFSKKGGSLYKFLESKGINE
ncbi:MAG: hypothetical protein IKL36_02160, partial [Clostridia bacterium]|nr:hypothetical protein [Clostridia bacterium]